MSQSVKSPDVSQSDVIYCSATICQYVNASDSCVWISTYIIYQGKKQEVRKRETRKRRKEIDNEIRGGLYCCLFVWCLSVSQERKENTSHLLALSPSPTLSLSHTLLVLICVSLSALKKGLLAKTPHCEPMIPKADTTKHERLLVVGGCLGVGWTLRELYYSSNPKLIGTEAFSQSLFAVRCLCSSLYSPQLLNPAVLHRIPFYMCCSSLCLISILVCDYSSQDRGITRYRLLKLQHIKTIPNIATLFSWRYIPLIAISNNIHKRVQQKWHIMI